MEISTSARSNLEFQIANGQVRDIPSDIPSHLRASSSPSLPPSSTLTSLPLSLTHMYKLTMLFPTLALVPTVLAHGIITTPPSRAIGPAIQSTCGQSVTTAIKSDNTSYVEQLTKLAAADKTYNPTVCNLYLCKGLQFADNTANVQTWKAGDVVPVKIWLRIPHEGVANVSVVDTRQNRVVGEFLKLWSKGYAPGRTEADVPVEQREFSVTVPTGLEGTCANAGDCVLQWWWLGTAAKQTYESCVDFKIAASAYRGRAFDA